MTRRDLFKVLFGTSVIAAVEPAQLIAAEKHWLNFHMIGGAVVKAKLQDYSFSTPRKVYPQVSNPYKADLYSAQDPDEEYILLLADGSMIDLARVTAITKS